MTLQVISRLPGFCENKSAPSGTGPGDDDFSFSPTANSNIVIVAVTDGYAETDFYCKDYLSPWRGSSRRCGRPHKQDNNDNAKRRGCARDTRSGHPSCERRAQRRDAESERAFQILKCVWQVDKGTEAEGRGGQCRGAA